MKNVVRQRGINFGEFTSSRIPLSTSRSPLSSPHRFATRHNRTRFAPLLFAPYSSKAYKYFSEQKSTEERGRRNRFCPGEMKNGQLANARSPTVTNRTRGRKHCALLGKFLEENLENARMCAPPSLPSSLTVDDGKLEKYQIEFGSWRTVIKSFEFLLSPPPIFLSSRIGKSIPAYIFV